MKSVTIKNKPPLSSDMLDINDVDIGVQVLVDDDKLWVNIDGICVLRVNGCKELDIELDVVDVNLVNYGDEDEETRI